MSKNKKAAAAWNPDLAWDGTGFVHASKEFLAEERKKFESMSYEEIADYILFGSPWSIAFRNLGWTKTRNGSRTIYRREEYGSCYIEEFHDTSFSHETEELVIDGSKATYTHTINESLTDEKRQNKNIQASYRDGIRNKGNRLRNRRNKTHCCNKKER